MRLLLPTFLLSLCCALPAAAQEDPGRAAEIRELEAMLARVDAAIADLETVVEPAVTFVQYDVRLLLFRPYDRPGPRLFIPGQAAGTRTGAGAGGFTFDESEEEESVALDPDQLEAMVVNTVGEDEWDDPRSIELHRGQLMVVQTELGHARIRRLLAELLGRQERGVQLEVAFYALPPELQQELEEAALAAEGALGPELLARLDAAVAEEPARLSGSAMLTSMHEQRVSLHQGAEQSFVSGYERSSGGTGNIVEEASDPIMEVLRSGLSLDVRATILGDSSGQVALDVRFVRARPTGMGQRTTPWGDIDVPQVTVDSVRTSAHVKPGGGMLVFSARGSGADATQPDVSIVVRPRVFGGR